MNSTEELRTHACVGSGFCCRKAACTVAVNLGLTDSEGRCRKLRYDRGTGIYRCALIETFPEYGVQLYAGEGCCANMNTDRQAIPSPEECGWPTGKGYATPAIPGAVERNDGIDWRAAYKRTAELLGAQFIGGDVMYLMVLGLKDEYPEAARLFMQAFRAHRSSSVSSFMGGGDES